MKEKYPIGGHSCGFMASYLLTKPCYKAVSIPFSSAKSFTLNVAF